MGSHLRQWLGDDLVVIGGLGGNGWELRFCGSGLDTVLSMPSAPEETLGGLARSAADGRSFVLDLRTAPPSVASWLRAERRFDNGSFSFHAAPSAAFDILLYADTITPYCSVGK